MSFDILICSVQGWQFLYISINISHFFFFVVNYSHPSRCDVIFICHCVITAVEHLFTWLTISIFSLEKCLFKYFLWLVLGIFILQSCRSSLYILGFKPVSDIWFANISPFYMLHFIFLIYLIHNSFYFWWSPTYLFFKILFVLLLLAELCPPTIHMLKSQLPVFWNVTVFGDRVFIEVIKLKWIH